jgi:hypothetical protein
MPVFKGNEPFSFEKNVRKVCGSLTFFSHIDVAIEFNIMAERRIVTRVNAQREHMMVEKRVYLLANKKDGDKWKKDTEVVSAHDPDNIEASALCMSNMPHATCYMQAIIHAGVRSEDAAQRLPQCHRIQ